MIYLKDARVVWCYKTITAIIHIMEGKNCLIKSMIQKKHLVKLITVYVKNLQKVGREKNFFNFMKFTYPNLNIIYTKYVL